MSLSITLLFLAALLGSGLMAGLFGAFSTFLMTALVRLGPADGMRAMQSVNRVILRPSFLLVFFGTGLASALLLVLRPGGAAGAWTLTGAVAYLVLCLGVTVFANVPLNRSLEAARAGSPEGEVAWRRYRVRWMRWNHLRSLATIIATVSFALALRAG